MIGAVGDTASAERAVALAERDLGHVGHRRHPPARRGADDAGVVGGPRAARPRHPRVVAIGETGLDYYYDHSPREAQHAAFARFLELAHAVGKPVVCYIRDALRGRARSSRAGRAGELGCVIHCFTGTPDDARAYADLGYCVSFSGIVTYKTAQALRDGECRWSRADRL